MYLLVWLLIQKKMYKIVYANNVIRQRRAFIMIPVCTFSYYVIPVFQCKKTPTNQEVLLWAKTNIQSLCRNIFVINDWLKWFLQNSFSFVLLFSSVPDFNALFWEQNEIKWLCFFLFSGSDSIFTRGKKGSRKLEERFSEKNKNVRICIKTRKVRICIP